MVLLVAAIFIVSIDVHVGFAATRFAFVRSCVDANVRGVPSFPPGRCLEIGTILRWFNHFVFVKQRNVVMREDRRLELIRFLGAIAKWFRWPQDDSPGFS